MTPERWQQVKQLFHSALQYKASERAAYLSSACGDDQSLRLEVESLIASHEKDGSFIDSPGYQVAAESLVNGGPDLKIGQSIGSYEIVSFISRGGMGEVYLAQDRRLARRVALKLLPASFTKDVDRLRRFEQEARAASALNHPNIITIYEIREVDNTRLIVTEFVEGETLRQRLAHGSLSLPESLQIAIQVADALDAAHKAGIIHRDIKPDNIMLRPDGYVKVLDFGLAKLAEYAPSMLAAEAPTKQVRTGSGIVMGTAGYMSPEQARGVSVDARSDIFSLGAVIYEMVAGRKPFDGETPSDQLAAILKTEPPPVSHFAYDAPAELVRIVTKALRKDREERYQVVKDLLLDLKSLKQELDFSAKLERSVVPHVTAGAVTHDGATRERLTPLTNEIKGPVTTVSESLGFEIKQHRFRRLLVVIGLVLLVTAAGFWLYKTFHRTSSPAHFQSMQITRLTNSGKAIDATLSPDGKYIVYVLSDAGKQSLWIRQVSTANDKLILPAAAVGFFGITFTRDGNELYYVLKANLDAGTLYRIPVLGGAPIKVLEKIDGPVSFSPDGKRLVLVRGNYPNKGESALVTANADGSGETTISIRKPPEHFSPIFFTGPSWSPDGKLIAAAVNKTGSPSYVLAVAPEGGKELKLTRLGSPYIARVEWLPDMSGLLAVAGDSPAGSQVWFLGYPDGEIRRITNDLNTYRAIGMTADGRRFSTVQASGLLNIWVAPGGDAKRAVQLPTGNVGFYTANGNNVTWTPDGHIVFVSNESGASDVWLMDPDGGNRKQLTSKAGHNLTPVVTSDGRYIVFSSTRAGSRNIWRMNLDGSNPKRLTSGQNDSVPAISPDGQWVVYSSLGSTHVTGWKVGIDGGDPVQLTDNVFLLPTISPDGKSVAYLYPESADPFAPPNRIGIISIDGGEPVRSFVFQGSGTTVPVAMWSADGRSILYTVNNNNVTNIWSQPLDGSAPKQLTDFKDSFMTGFSWSRDGKQLACLRGILLRDAVLITDQQ